MARLMAKRMVNRVMLILWISKIFAMQDAFYLEQNHLTEFTHRYLPTVSTFVTLKVVA